jgi:hypothetical protein
VKKRKGRAKCSAISAKQLTKNRVDKGIVFYVHYEVQRSVHLQTKVCTLARTVKQHNYAVGVEKQANKEAAILLSGLPTASPLHLQPSAATRYPYCCEQRAMLTSSHTHQPLVTQHRGSRQVHKFTHPEAAATTWSQQEGHSS